MGYFNSIAGNWNYEDFFFQEFIPTIEKNYRIRTNKQYRAVAGLSMGGGGSFMYALHHPELFSSACPLSAYVGPLTIEEAKSRVKKSNPEITDEAQIKAYFENHNAIALVNKMTEDQKKEVRWYIDCGDDDFLYEGNSLIHIAMRKKILLMNSELVMGSITGHTGVQPYPKFWSLSQLSFMKIKTLRIIG